MASQAASAARAEALFRALCAAPGVLLTGPIGPDGDSLGASLALGRILADRGVDVQITGDVGQRYAFLPGADRLITDDAVGERADWHTVCVLDGDRHRLPPGVERAWHAAERRYAIDHHRSTTEDGYDLAWIDAGATSTCHMVLGLLRRLGVALDEELATLLHTGAVFDTGGLRFENTTPTVLRDAAELVERGAPHADICTEVLLERRFEAVRALGRVTSTATLLAGGRVCIGTLDRDFVLEHGLVPDDLEGIVDHLLFIRGVEIAALLFERADHTKVSLRSRGSVDVAALAARLSPSGGGHRRAAGARATISRDAILAGIMGALPTESTEPG